MTLIYFSGIALVGLLLLGLQSCAPGWPHQPLLRIYEGYPESVFRSHEQPIEACAPLAMGCSHWWRFSFFGFHVYWARYASERKSKFQETAAKTTQPAN